MYADDNRDVLVMPAICPIRAFRACGADEYAWTLSTWISIHSTGATDITYDMVKRPLWPYTGKNANIYPALPTNLF